MPAAPRSSPRDGTGGRAARSSAATPSRAGSRGCRGRAPHLSPLVSWPSPPLVLYRTNSSCRVRPAGVPGHVVALRGDTSPVSERTVEAAKTICERWARGDFSDVSWAHPEIAFATRDFPDPVVTAGIPALSEAWANFLREWDHFRTVGEEYFEFGDSVLVVTSFRGRAKRSGVLADGMPGACVITFRDGLATRLVLYNNRERA